MKKFCTFLINGNFFGLDISKVIALVKEIPIIRVPLASRFVKGLIQYRGQIITVISVRRIFELPEVELDEKSAHVIVRTKYGLVSFLVDELKDIEEITRNIRIEVPKVIQGVDRFFVSQAYRIDETLLFILDSEKVVEFRSDRIS
jgi:purine-binding chemotaxis protein CheW